MRMVHVLRKPLSEGTVAANVLKHGCGGLNIDASRVKGGPSSGGSISGASALGQGSGWNAHANRTTQIDRSMSSGRWPANVILQHSDGCRCEGVKRVKACGVGAFKRSTAKDRNGQTGAAYGAESRPEGTEYVNYADAEGKETVANWICAEGCPVARLDEDTGSLKVRGNRGPSMSSGNRDVYGKFNAMSCGTQYNHDTGNTGGASRFFKQIGGKKDA